MDLPVTEHLTAVADISNRKQWHIIKIKLGLPVFEPRSRDPDSIGEIACLTRT